MLHTSTYAQTFLPVFQAYQDEYLQRLATLVNINSGTGQVEGINQVMEHLRQWLHELDCDVCFHESRGFGHNLVARRKGNGHKRILLVGHVDTVYPAGAVEQQPFAIRGGIASGPGVIDMKSGVVMGVYALRALIESGCDQFREVILLFNNDEEIGSPGSDPLLRELAQQVDYALVLEPAGKSTSVTHARKGSDKYMLEVSGISAHSGVEPFKGRSAVIELAHKIVAIQNLHALFPNVTFNITRLNSTEQLNIVPDMARCHISVRAYTKQGLNMAAEALEKIAASCTVPDTQARLSRKNGRPPYEATPAILQLLKIAEQEAEALDFHLVAEPKGGVSDANILVDAGVPTLDTLGPVGGGMHNLEREHLQVNSVPLRGALVAGLIKHLCLI